MEIKIMDYVTLSNIGCSLYGTEQTKVENVTTHLIAWWILHNGHRLVRFETLLSKCKDINDELCLMVRIVGFISAYPQIKYAYPILKQSAAQLSYDTRQRFMCVAFPDTTGSRHSTLNEVGTDLITHIVPAALNLVDQHKVVHPSIYQL